MIGRAGLWIAGTIGLAGCVAGWALAPAETYAAWLAAIDFFLGAGLGALAVSMIVPLSGGARWGTALDPALLALARPIPVLCLLLLPILIGMRSLYPWASAAEPNHLYLNAPFFVLRMAGFAAIWIGAVFAWRAASKAIAAVALILLALTVTFASIDWTMSLEPAYVSSAYGMVAIAGHLLAGLTIAILLTPTQAPEINRDLGTLLLSLVLVWGYLAFMEFLIVYSENLSSEIPWYLKRSTGLWGALGLTLVATHIAVPFLMLLARVARERRGILIAVAALVALSELGHEFWLVLPEFPSLALIWIAPSAALLIGAIHLAAAFAPLPVPLRRYRHG